MRHFLKFLPPDKREEAKRQYGEPAPLEKTDDRKAGVTPRSIEAFKQSFEKIEEAHVPARSPVPGPEFGGLIERRKRVNRPAPGQERRADVFGEARAALNGASQFSDFELKAHFECAESLGSSTGSFLKSLENSSITLADSGIFKPEQRRARDTFNPYDKG